jgi:hypothetical protein
MMRLPWQQWRDQSAAVPPTLTAAGAPPFPTALPQLAYPEGRPIGRTNIAVSRQVGNDHRTYANDITRFGSLPSVAC